MVNLSAFSVVDTGHHLIKHLKNTCPFDFINRGEKKLVVTVGDSWSWGADMTPDNNNEYRLKHHFGQLLADNLAADWLSLAQSGSGNFWIYDRVRELATVIPELAYDCIYVVCTLTETGRAVSARQDIDFYKFFQHNHPSEFVKYLNNLCVDNIVSALKPFDNIVLKVGTNFVDYLGNDHEFVMPTSWLELMCQHHGIEYTDNCQIVSSWVIDEFKQLSNLVPGTQLNNYLNLLNSLLDSALKRRNLVRSLPDTNYSHPMAQSHKLWADYVLKSM